MDEVVTRPPSAGATLTYLIGCSTMTSLLASSTFSKPTLPKKASSSSSISRFSQPLHRHNSSHFAPTLKQTQYFFKHLEGRRRVQISVRNFQYIPEIESHPFSRIQLTYSSCIHNLALRASSASSQMPRDS